MFSFPDIAAEVILKTDGIPFHRSYHDDGFSDTAAAWLSLFVCGVLFSLWIWSHCPRAGQKTSTADAAGDEISPLFRYVCKSPFALPLIASLPCILDGVNFSLASGVLARLGIKNLLRQSLVVGSYQIGQMVSAVCLPLVMDAHGRKATLQLVAVGQVLTFGVCASWSYGADDFSWLVLAISRFVAGVFFGQTVAPVYIAEIAEPSTRGAAVSCVEISTVFGSLLGIVVLTLLSDSRLRLVFQFFTIFAAFNSLLITMLPSRNSSASGEAGHPQTQKCNIEPGNQADSASGLSALTDTERRALQIGCVLAFLQQSAGEEAVFGFCIQIAADAGFARPLLFGLALGVLVFACNLLSNACGIDEVGRRPVLLVGALGMGSAWAMAAVSAWQGLGAFAVLACILVYELFSGLSLGPVLFVVVTEVLPDHLRAYGNGLALLVSRVTACVAVLTFNLKNYYMSLVGVFVVYAITMFVGAVYIVRNVPETANKTFDEIQNIL